MQRRLCYANSLLPTVSEHCGEMMFLSGRLQNCHCTLLHTVPRPSTSPSSPIHMTESCVSCDHVSCPSSPMVGTSLVCQYSVIMNCDRGETGKHELAAFNALLLTQYGSTVSSKSTRWIRSYLYLLPATISQLFRSSRQRIVDFCYCNRKTCCSKKSKMNPGPMRLSA